MKLYVISDSISHSVRGLTSKEWIATLFLLQRRELNNNLKITIQKSDDSLRFSYKMNDLYINYFSGFALTNLEIEYVNYQLSMYPDKQSVIEFENEYNNSETIRKFLKKYKKKGLSSYLDEFARRAILNPSEVQDLVYQKRFFENIKKGT